MDNLIFHIMVCNSLWGVVITPKKRYVNQQYMGYDMSANSIDQKMQKGTKFEVNASIPTIFLVIFGHFCYFLGENLFSIVPVDEIYTCFEWKYQNHWLLSVSFILGGEIEVKFSTISWLKLISFLKGRKPWYEIVR